jgi:hypothetical protein
MNYPKDMELSRLGKILLDAGFQAPLTARAALRQPAIDVAEIENKLRGVKLSPNAKPVYLVQSYIGGEVRTFCSVRLDVYLACRIADVLTYKFGHLRLKFPRPTEDPDYNYTKEQAQLDYDNEPAIRSAVDGIFEHLRSLGALLDPTGAASPVPRDKRTVLLSRLDAIEAKLDLILKGMK